MGKQTNCDYCQYYSYDEELESNVCLMNLDQDEMERFLTFDTGHCPYYRYGDEYTLARKQ